MLSLPGNSERGCGRVSKEIHLVDTDFEDGETLKSFLVLVTKLQWDINVTDLLSRRAFLRWRPRLLKLLYFLDKYDSDIGARALQLWGSQMSIMGYWHKGTGHQNGFIFGAMTNNIALCFRLASQGPLTWSAEAEPLDSREAGHLFDIASAPYEFTCALPTPYVFALSRARLAGEPGTKPFADEFLSVITAALEANGSYFAQSCSITDLQRQSTCLSRRRCLP